MTQDGFSYETVKSFWQERAHKYDKMDQRSLTFFCEDPTILDKRDRQEKELIAGLLPYDPQRKLLEVGCGAGRWTAFLAHRSGTMVAFDISEGLVEIAREEAAKAEAENVVFRIGDVRDFLVKEQFDVITIFGVLIYLHDDGLDGFIANALQMLAPDGIILQKDPVAQHEGKIECGWSEKLAANYCCIYRTQEEYQQAFAAAGLTLSRAVEVYGVEDEFAPRREGISTRIFIWQRR